MSNEPYGITIGTKFVLIIVIDVWLLREAAKKIFFSGPANKALLLPRDFFLLFLRLPLQYYLCLDGLFRDKKMFKHPLPIRRLSRFFPAIEPAAR